MMRAYKFRLYPNKAQRKEMQTHLWLSKNLWNEELEFAKNIYRDFGKFPSKKGYYQITKTSGLYSQVATEVYLRLEKALKAKIRRKNAGIKGGFPRFKSMEHAKSITYSQHGFSLNGKKLKVTPFGEINIKKHREIEGKIKTLTLKREATGKWYAILTVENPTQPEQFNNGSKVGIDLGLKTFATLSDGTTIKNPRHLKHYEEKLRKKSQQLSYKKRGSKNRKKAKLRLAVLHEKIKNTRKDFLHKLSHKLVHAHSFIALEDLRTQEMAEKNFGKQINDAGWSDFISMLSYKAESAGSRVVLVNPKNTTKMCSGCGTLVKKDLWDRQHNCHSCGLSMDRDLNAAINILNIGIVKQFRLPNSKRVRNRATDVQSESNACGDVSVETPMKQESVSNIEEKLDDGMQRRVADAYQKTKPAF